jgi:hypothetical protein
MDFASSAIHCPEAPEGETTLSTSCVDVDVDVAVADPTAGGVSGPDVGPGGASHS